MAHELIGGPELRTRFAGAPELTFHAPVDRTPVLEVFYQIEPAPAGALAGFARLRFAATYEFRWIETDCYYAITNPDDFAFAPIRIMDSAHIALMLDSGMRRDQEPGQRFGGVVDERELNHYRIGFDDWGAVDIIALGVEIGQERRPS